MSVKTTEKQRQKDYRTKLLTMTVLHTYIETCLAVVEDYFGVSPELDEALKGITNGRKHLEKVIAELLNAAPGEN